jgi:hypothetical protein
MTVSGVHPVSHSMATAALSQGAKTPGCEASKLHRLKAMLRMPVDRLKALLRMPVLVPELHH